MLGRHKEKEGWVVFDSLMLISAGTISLTEGAAIGHIEEPKKDGSTGLKDSTRERERESE